MRFSSLVGAASGQGSLNDDRMNGEKLGVSQLLDIVGIGSEDGSATQTDRDSDHDGVDGGSNSAHPAQALETGCDPGDILVDGKDREFLEDLVHRCIPLVTEESFGEDDRRHHDADAGIPRGLDSSLGIRLTPRYGPQPLAIENQRGPWRRRTLGYSSSNH